MHFIEHEEALEAAGFKREQVRALMKFVASGDAEAFTKRDGEIMDQKNQARFDKQDARIDRLEGQIEALGHKLVATIWTVAGVLLATFVGLSKLSLL